MFFGSILLLNGNQKGDCEREDAMVVILPGHFLVGALPTAIKAGRISIKKTFPKVGTVCEMCSQLMQRIGGGYTTNHKSTLTKRPKQIRQLPQGGHTGLDGDESNDFESSLGDDRLLCCNTIRRSP